ncbi:DNA repair protein RadA [Microgenomates group bacterium RBG_19FT_COMBO_39_10]|nr:MAG: DNA repair protein RadA [Microgenomates group bacterium RBG_19FT_COMBO_39_10]
MAKPITKFVCQQCGAEAPKWLGRCPQCGEWNSLVETKLGILDRSGEKIISQTKPQKLSQIKSVFQVRMKTGISEFDLVLGGGVVSGSVILVSGEPGIGKSTLMLQLISQIDRKGIPPLYVSGEESLQQIKIRAQRLNLKIPETLFLTETNVETICAQIRDLRPKMVIIDSIQTCWTSSLSGMAGSVGQVRESAAMLLKVAKKEGIPLLLVGHVTKAGAIAGPKVLEHMVDTVIYLEGERFGGARLLRATKNRFGATDEVGVFEMTDKGLIEVTNPSRLFLKERVKKTPGSVVVATLEGTRPVLVEIQALVVPTTLVIPRRIGQGIDGRRLQLISAVLTKQLRLPLATFDVYVNVVGGIRIDEPGSDLGVALAIISSFKGISLDPKTVCFGEIGLLGEIREISQTDKRKKEARKLGLTEIISPEKFTSVSQLARELFNK